MTAQRLVVTTTGSLEGWEIENYLGPVSAHIVAGTGFFSDFAASFSDIFGGRSQSYQKQLAAINDEAVELLKKKASLIGGNAIVGLHIDHDEISGKAKQMFMVTAYGTVVIASQKLERKERLKTNTAVSGEDVQFYLTKKDILKNCEKIPVSLNEEQWQFLIENQVGEVVEPLITSLEYYDKKEYNVDQYINYLYSYLIALPSNISIPPLYNWLTRTTSRNGFILGIIKDAEIFDFAQIISILSAGDIRSKKDVLKICFYEKATYTIEDIQAFKELIDKINSSFPEVVKYIDDKALLSSNKTRKWICLCGSKNSTDVSRCQSCGKDKFGFLPGELFPIKAIEVLSSKLEYLLQVFKPAD